MEKGVEFTIGFSLIRTDGTADTTSTPACSVAQGLGNFAASSNSAVRRTLGGNPTNAFRITLSGSEMDGGLVSFMATADECVSVNIDLYPEANWTAEKAGYVDAEVSSRATPGNVDDAEAAILAGISELLARFAQAVLSPISPVSEGGDITLYRGIDYAVGLGNAIEFALPVATHGDLGDATAVLQTDEVGLAGEVINGGTADQLVRFELTQQETAGLWTEPTESRYMLLVTLDGEEELKPTPKARGSLSVRDLPQPVDVPTP